MAGLVNLPKAKWIASGRQVGLKGDMIDIETALPQLLGLTKTPPLVYVDATSIKAAAGANYPASVMMLGFPDVVNPGQFITGGLTDNTFYQNTIDATADFDVSASLWGTEKASQWYAVLAIPGASAPAFSLKMMPLMRVKSQTTQTIKTGTNITPATGINYAFTDDEFVGGMLYFLSGDSKGLLRTITTNVVDTDTAITYSGTALTVAAGDWFIILPPINFRYLGSIYNLSSGDILSFNQDGNIISPVTNSTTYFVALSAGQVERVAYIPPLADMLNVMVKLSGGLGLSIGSDGNHYWDLSGDGTHVMAFRVNDSKIYEDFGSAGDRYIYIMSYRMIGL